MLKFLNPPEIRTDPESVTQIDERYLQTDDEYIDLHTLKEPLVTEIEIFKEPKEKN